MEAKEEVVGGPKDQTHISKRKRAKRQRTQSLIPFAINANEDTTSSPATTSTEEEEDMANCLILLAQGLPWKENWSPKCDGQVEYSDKYTSKRYVETVSNGNGKVGVYVYQCRTCDRTFPSFQALGGHRASHKRPKVGIAELSDDEERQFKNHHHMPSLSLQMLSSSAKAFHGGSGSGNGNGTKLKVHGCSVCGAEFSSGQALGGHMRRHRGTTPATTTASSSVALSLTPSSPEEANRARNGLSLDLNLPAPDDDHQSKQPKLAFPSKHKHKQQQQQQQLQQSPLVFSATPTLVDCHY